tara:strand:+ start:38805 stop:39350 length:546 start_codon:yes stop_codon:yes gene_type:complete
MKFTTAWANIASQNISLKLATVTLAVTSIVQLIAIINFTSKDLPVIERGCFSRAIIAKPLENGKNEIESFLAEALPMRFDTHSYIRDGFLSLEQLTIREKELSSLKQKEISQKLIISEIKSDTKEITVRADRLMSVGKIKSVLPIQLTIALQKTNRTESNPYGLVLSSVTQVEINDKDNSR